MYRNYALMNSISYTLVGLTAVARWQMSSSPPESLFTYLLRLKHLLWLYTSVFDLSSSTRDSPLVVDACWMSWSVPYIDRSLVDARET
jgi:hypothetical protein